MCLACMQTNMSLKMLHSGLDTVWRKWKHTAAYSEKLSRTFGANFNVKSNDIVQFVRKNKKCH